MKKIIIVFIFILLIGESKSQNLVPNPSFEDTLSCPTGAAGIYAANNWGSCLGSPDYFNLCAPSCLPPQSCVGIPNNFAGTQNAFSGGAYSGIILTSFVGMNREIIITELIDTLEIGKKYFFSCYIARAYESSTHGASNNFGFRFSTVEFDYINEVSITNYSHYRDTTIITDTTNWTRIEGSFFADSLYRYILLGNFYDDSNTDTTEMRPTTAPWNHAYYYVDQVCVTLDSGNCSLINDTPIQRPESFPILFPNPFIDKLFISTFESDKFNIEIFDSLGRLILKSKLDNGSGIDVSAFEKGIYYYSIQNINGKFYRGKVLKI